MKKDRKDNIKHYENEMLAMGNQVTGSLRKHYYL